MGLSLGVGRIGRGVALVVACLVVTTCGGGGPSALPLGKEAVVDHTQISGNAPLPRTTLGITVLAVRTGTIAELEAGGFTVDADQRNKTPYYVDVRFENKGNQTIDRSTSVAMEDQSGNLISSVVIFNYGDVVYAPCPDNSKGTVAPGEHYESCTLFLVAPDRTPARVGFLPNTPGKDTDWVYWSVK